MKSVFVSQCLDIFRRQLLIIFIAVWSVHSQAKTIDVSKHGIVKDDFSDSTRALLKVLELAKATGTKKIVFPTGRYDFYPARAVEKIVYISNNDPGIKRIIFPLYDFHDLEIDGNGSQFIFHGTVNPFVIDQSKNIKLTNFSFDFSRPFHSEGVILATDKGSMDLHIPEAFPYEINSSGILRFLSDGVDPPYYAAKPSIDRRKMKDLESAYYYKRLLEFDSEKRETVYQQKDIHTGNALPAKKLPGNRNIRIFHPKLKGNVGNVIVFQATYRRHPGIVISDSAEVDIDGVTIHHAGGMGVLAQRTHNITVQNSQVTPSEGRMVSTTADATHFVNCTGKIQLLNNVFENQKDDATNIHGIYVMVDRILDEKTLEVRLQHPQQYGFDFIDTGDILEFVHAPSLITYSTAKVASSQRISKEITRVVFETPLPDKTRVGDSIAEVRDYPEVIIRGNTIRRNRARGMLLNCRGKTVVEDNYFHSPGTALLFEGDASYWYEQGGVNDLVVRNNTFDNSHYTDWGSAVIAVAAGIDDEYKKSARYNKNILVENNLFRVFDRGPILDLFSVENFRFRNNTIEKTDAYPERAGRNKFFEVNHSDNVVIEDNNKFIGF